MADFDYYEALEIERGADADQIKKAYRRLAMKYHPDRNEGDAKAEARFKQISEAYSVLSDPDKRAQYDRFGRVGGPGMGGGGFNTADIDPFEIFRNFMGGFGFGDIFGGEAGGRRGPRTYRGRDIQVNLAVTLEDIAEGGSKKIRVNRYEECDVCDGLGTKEGKQPTTCSTCKGAGEVKQVTRSFFGQMVNITACPTCEGRGTVIEDPCEECKGEGRVKDSSTVEIEIPAGVTHSAYMTLAGEGHVGPWGGPSGDLVVVFEEKEHDTFERHKDDVLLGVTISVPDAVLGTTMEVPTLNGSVELDIPAGVQPGKVLRLRNKGIRHLNASGRGDQLVRVDVYIPEKLSAEDRRKIEELADLESMRPPERAKKGFFHKMREAFFGGE